MLGTDHEPGIYVRTLNDLFRAIEETSDDMEYEVSMSYLEVSPPRSSAWMQTPWDGAWTTPLGPGRWAVSWGPPHYSSHVHTGGPTL